LLPNCYKRLKISPALDGVFALNLDFMSKQAWLWKILEAPRKKSVGWAFLAQDRYPCGQENSYY